MHFFIFSVGMTDRETAEMVSEMLDEELVMGLDCYNLTPQMKTTQTNH